MAGSAMANENISGMRNPLASINMASMNQLSKCGAAIWLAVMWRKLSAHGQKMAAQWQLIGNEEKWLIMRKLKESYQLKWL